MTGLLKNRNGNVAILTAMLMPVVLMFSGGAVDFFNWNNQRVKLKELADTLATRGAREFLLANATEFQVKAVINNVIDSGYAAAYGFPSLATEINVNTLEGEVSVHLSSPPADALLLNKFQPFKQSLDITSTAVAHGGMNVCVVALERTGDGAVSATTNSKLLADECSIMSNSKSTQGVVSSGNSKIEAGLICSAGGAYGNVHNYAPFPTLDCPHYADPLSEREAPAVGVCDEVDAVYGHMIEDVVSAAANVSTNLISAAAKGHGGGKVNKLINGAGLSETTYTLNPGVYCGGLTIGTLANVELNPGIYVIKDGPLLVGLSGKLSGENVSFYLVGDDATFYFGPEAVISLTAPKDGPLAGILFFEDRNAPADRTHYILSDDARVLLGTFYLSRGTLAVASLLPVADQSAYTAIVAKKLSMSGNPTLVLNADYAGTDVPVPEGVGPVGNTVYLRE
ncbi:TadE/TadG family type IV pilus assembly protein [Hyphococcus sp.]|uniref:TadE/TadG family type IV pilus assembly protein n=1 Tax=Hyphococcus sp. TaxID=2038636 RepID=UPI003D124C41